MDKRVEALREEVRENPGKLLVNILRGREVVRQVVLDDPRHGWVAEYNRQAEEFGCRAAVA